MRIAMMTGKRQFSFDDGDYSRMDEKTLIVLEHIYLLFPLRTAAYYLRATTTDIETIWNQSGMLALNTTEQNMAQLFRLSSGNGRVIAYFIDWKMRRLAMERVLNERLQRFPFTSELTAFGG